MRTSYEGRRALRARPAISKAISLVAPTAAGILMKRDLYAEVSARIIAELETGATPWIKPWSTIPGANTPCNAVTNRP
jgi:antirestriction protein ArdC